MTMPAAGVALDTIPSIAEAPNWARLPIVGSDEPLVPLSGLERERIFCRSIYAELGIPGAPHDIRVRAGVRDRLLAAVESLPKTLGLLVVDGWRPLSVQAWLWRDYAAQLQKQNPNLVGAALRDAVGLFVASPNADPAAPPPHRTGGAVDLTLIEIDSGDQLPMGTPLDAAVPESATAWFERYPTEPYTTNRRRLYHAMAGAGFTNYAGEWWHFDYGNQRWANVAQLSAAIYGVPAEELL